jgi:predicted unusual protein kinase regulating ubiquinone biosynthesis (AarF/ABC1/UbiB family)
MTISLKAEHLKRYKDIVLLFLKYGRSDVFQNKRLDDSLREEGNTPDVEEGNIGKDLERLGPTFIKIGQLLSTRAELFPTKYLEQLSVLQDNVEPFSFSEVEQIVASELGFRLSKVFREFCATPIAAASLGQVHQAILLDGRNVAVKVQRPGIRSQILTDLSALAEVAKLVDKHTETGMRLNFNEMLEEFEKTILRELDYRQEARNLAILKQNLAGFEKIIVPSPLPDLTTELVLTMEYIHGKKITSLGPLAKIEVNGRELAEELFAAYLRQILVDGFFHADPHPGNVFVTEDGKIALLDMGMVGQVLPRMQENLLQFVLAISEGRGEEASELAIKIGQPLADFDEATFSRKAAMLVAEHHGLQMKELQVGKIVLQVTRLSAQFGLRPPPELTLLGKALLNLDQIGRSLDPDFDPNEAIRKNGAEILRQRIKKNLSPSYLFGSAIELKDFLERLPARLNKILDSAAANQLKIKVDAIDEASLIEGLQKIANRITLGLVLAALIIGAALLMRVENTSFRILGYPGIAILFFLIAAAAGLFLVLSILWNDSQGIKKSKTRL